jgi:hypothetical protein
VRRSGHSQVKPMGAMVARQGHPSLGRPGARRAVICLYGFQVPRDISRARRGSDPRRRSRAAARSTAHRAAGCRHRGRRGRTRRASRPHRQRWSRSRRRRVPKLGGGGRVEHDRVRDLPRVPAQRLTGSFVEQHLVPLGRSAPSPGACSRSRSLARSAATNRAPSAAMPGGRWAGSRPVRSTCQPASSRRRAVARPIGPVPPMMRARGTVRAYLCWLWPDELRSGGGS